MLNDPASSFELWLVAFVTKYINEYYVPWKCLITFLSKASSQYKVGYSFLENTRCVWNSYCIKKTCFNVVNSSMKHGELANKRERIKQQLLSNCKLPPQLFPKRSWIFHQWLRCCAVHFTANIIHDLTVISSMKIQKKKLKENVSMQFCICCFVCLFSVPRSDLFIGYWKRQKVDQDKNVNAVLQFITLHKRY